MENKTHDLRWMAIELTGRCNLSCVHCRSANDETDRLSLDDCKKIIDDVTSFSKPVLVLSGGEPLLREDIFDIAAYGTEKGLRIGMATNGLLVTTETTVQMKESGVRIVSLSLDAATAEVHDSFRRQDGAFDATVRAAGILKDAGIPFIINSSFTRVNQDSIKETFKLAKSLGAKAWYMFIVLPAGRAESDLDVLIDAETYDRLLRWHYEAEKNEEDMLMRPTCAPHYYRLISELNRESDESLERRSLTFSTGGAKGCIAGQSICFVSRTGDVFPCSYLSVKAGNLLKTPMSEIWESSPVFKDLRDIDGYKGGCGVCEYRKVCGGCRVRAHVMRGDMLEKDPLCDFTPKRIEQKS